MDKLPYKSPQGITFSIYSTKEIKKLSVLEINNPNPFDTLEHPTYGGLYDPHLGPNDREELCETCGLTSFHCPGHVGHINLPLPVFNPLFMQTLYQLLRGTCFNCHRLLAPVNAIHLALYQFQALDYGLVETVQELGEAVTDPSLTASGKIGSVAYGLTIENKLKSIISKATAGLDLEESKYSARVKNVVECRQGIMKKFIKEHLMGAKGKCPHCGGKKAKIALRLKSRFVFTSGKVKNNVRTKPHSRLGSEDEEEFNDTIETEAESVDHSNADLSPIDAKMHMNLLWMNDRNLLEHLFGILYVEQKYDVKSPMNIFFMEAILVPPSRFRPLAVVKGRKYLNPQSAAFKDVVQDSVVLRNLLRLIKNETINEVDQEYINRLKGKNNNDKMSNMWQELQKHINIVFDSDFDKLNRDKVSSGVKQILEKKEGLFRKHMMGKRVNFSARSVISPDPYIMVDEIGVPTIFAKKLTYCQPVNHWNVQKLRAAVLNGPDVHPGAEKVENGDGLVTRLSATDPVQRHAIACKLLTPSLSCHGSSNGDNIKKVHRHLENGDVLLLNRQPTLHKPSIMAHRARILPGEKTLRLHYANCKAYNADFDGDEMNLHFPQTEHSRAEGYNLTSVNQQYLVPKDGTPLSGLIQDHIIAGTLLTMRGRFFTREDYEQLLYCAISFVHKRVKTLPPCIIKPQKLWSGKQVVSSVIINVMPLGKPPPTVLGKAKVSAKNWQSSPPRQWKAGGTPLKDDDMSESDVIIHCGELLCGVIDKASIGPTPYGLIHCCYELYGGETSTLLLTSLARLFTHFLQIHSGFTLGIEDILLTEKATKKRQKIMKRAKKVGDEVVSQALYATDSNNKEELHEKYKEAHLSKDDTGLKTLDFEMKRKTDSFNNDINAICMPDGLMKKFPSNNLQLMIQSGAKGSTVNAMQISCLLGQIELEGRRVPLMLNGGSLPSFLPYDTSPRAGGFVDGRFLTGIRPQEYFFHCMAGREGLVDTAVKTSRSGYLQRCLIKHLEGIVVNYDMTVRDSDGSVVQFLYGEDGLDIPKIQMLKEKQFHLLAKNYNAVMNEPELKMFEAGQLSDDPEKYKKAVSRWKKKYTSSKTRGRCSGFLNFEKANSHLFAHLNQIERKSVLVQEWADLDHKEKQRFTKHTKKCPDPVNAHYRPDLVFGSVSENLDNIIEKYIKKNPHGILCNKDEDDSKDGIIGPRKFLSVEKFRRMSHYRALKALAHPGEAVGLLAAQSVGEPSTQMTLNTFHFAGRGEMNVTLGIPRLREILMVASANIATPTMELPLLDKPGVEDEAEHLKIKLSSVALKQVLETIVIREVLSVKSRGNRFRIYHVRMNFLPYEAYNGTLYTSPSAILNYVEHFFIKRVVDKTKKILSAMSSFKLISSSSSNLKAFRPTGVDRDEMKHPDAALVDLDGASSDEGDADDDEDTVANKTKMRHNQDTEYENPEAGEMPETESDDDSSNEADVNIKEENEVDLNIKEENEADIDIKEENVTNINIKKEIVTDSDDHDDFDIESLSKKDILQNELLEDQKTDRVNYVKDIHKWIDEYDFDPHSQQWCEFTLQLRLDGSKIDMRSLIEEEANKAIVYEIPKIKKAFLVKNPSSENGKEKMLTTEGVNFLEMFKYVDLIDANKVYSNDIHSIALIYGIEAATRVIVKEITNVFARYGIAVDPRHLMLIADYMTFDGTYKPCNRVGMESSASPLQQMTFETTMNFLKNATLGGSVDQLKSPSSRLVLGKVVSGGTGCFDLLMKNISVSGSVKRK